MGFGGRREQAQRSAAPDASGVSLNQDGGEAARWSSGVEGVDAGGAPLNPTNLGNANLTTRCLGWRRGMQIPSHWGGNQPGSGPSAKDRTIQTSETTFLFLVSNFEPNGTLYFFYFFGGTLPTHVIPLELFKSRLQWHCSFTQFYEVSVA